MRVAELLLTLSLVGEALPATAAEADEAIDVDVSSLELLKRHQVDFWTPWESNTNATSAAALLLRSETSGCVDKNWQCYGWARLGYCSSNAGYMDATVDTAATSAAGNPAGASTSHAGSTLNAAPRDVPRTPITADLLVDDLAFSFTFPIAGQSSPDKILVDG
eukprot:CAMPEP_0181402504 /NCGR_PEP_ID=MMETSP1110-20121109/3209_1 /TAXON_ID=174948 /ORGANISM="Symbiodinium sp., Strain CCMP421" /LENGTH=162 /DNA_ID=CAMNT_0023524725 /DNA_START=73 /DNA_END=560 /DNA_ORIENTATION=+